MQPLAALFARRARFARPARAASSTLAWLALTAALPACNDDGTREEAESIGSGTSATTAVPTSSTSGSDTATASTGSATATAGTTSDGSTATASSGATTGTTAASATGTTTGSTGTTAASATGTTSDVRFDVGATDTAATAGDGGVADTCQKVDILFVIDNSPSMREEQLTLVSNFPTFISEMQAALSEVMDYHIGVITTDDYVDGSFPDDGRDTVNQGVAGCQTLGGLVVRTGPGGDCRPFAGGGNYITEQDDLSSKFSCIANVDEDGDSDEKVFDGIVESFGPTLTAPGACNAGFFRPDALLILVILTDENDSSEKYSSGGLFGSLDLNRYRDDVVAFKGGVPENVVVLALIWDEFESNCSSDLSESTGSSIEDFARLFPRNSVGNICDSSYAGFFSSAVPSIEGACEEFVPPG
jgi:hypothetical protein